MQDVPSKGMKRKVEVSSGHSKKKSKVVEYVTQTSTTKAKVPNSPPPRMAARSPKPRVTPTSATKAKVPNSPPPTAAKSPKPRLPQEPTKVDLTDRYPILKNVDLVSRFLNVTMTNNQKGRIRQNLKDSLKGTSGALLPDVIHDKINTIIKTSKSLNDAELRKLRILYNMLKTAAKSEPLPVKKKKTLEPPVKKIGKEGDGKTVMQKVKGPKRYIVFLGNLPIGVTKEKIINHFSDMSASIKSLRIPKQSEHSNSAIAYLEVSNEHFYELALSKNHTMLGNKRINVLYTTQVKSKTSKSDAKSKSAKLLAMQKSGKLLGSVPMNRKRSTRRKKMKEAQKKATKELSS